MSSQLLHALVERLDKADRNAPAAEASGRRVRTRRLTDAPSEKETDAIIEEMSRAFEQALDAADSDR